ncbi:hypothetical protein EIC82_04035 [Enterobacter sp. A11]|uniref:hypothetical protein n=1 Tax=unclassified Enterobacter TaxID=2608935 RepID=UPI0010703DCB|nr:MULTISPECIES: hypothetical protein [unclassified Enterobacter]MBM1020184.1 hypothetical protein [Enterobacter sp. E1]MEA3561485.1 hypothetical protein [Enterobacter sp. GM-22]MEA3595218.1 hypothetical protein [Enterobacter sp. GM-31]TFF60356.1 hypothetical protein EIC82_04035 [Enterobacter sp. A11]
MADENQFFITSSDCFLSKLKRMGQAGQFDWIAVTDEASGKKFQGIEALKYYIQQTLDDAQRQRTAPGFHYSYEDYLKSVISQFERGWRYEGKIEYGAEYALLHYHLSLYLYQHKSKEEGIHHLMEAMHYLGSYEGNYLLQNYLGVQQRNKVKASAAGGKAKADKNQIVKDKAAELLKEKGPELIGLSEREQAEIVARALWDFIVAYNEETKKINKKVKVSEQNRRLIDLTEDALPDTLLKWWKKMPEQKGVLDGVVAEKN